MNEYLNDDHPIFEACRIGDYEAVEKFLRGGGSVYAESEHNPAIFGIAANKEHRDILELMLRHGLDIRRPYNRFGSSLALLAIKKDNLEWLEYFIGKGISIDAVDDTEHTLLNMATSGGRLQCLRFLIMQGACLEKRSRSGGTPIFEAARNNQIAALEILNRAGANREARDGDQNTPLIIAAKAGKFEAVEWLLNHGADIYAKDERGKTALDWAKANGHQKIVELIQLQINS